MVSPDRLTALFAQYHAPLVRFLTRRLGDRDWAEEIAQETFVRALRQETITRTVSVPQVQSYTPC